MKKSTRADWALWIAIGGFVVSLTTLWLYWTEIQVDESVVLTPIEIGSADNAEGARALRFDFTVANNGDRSARLVELCLVPKPRSGASSPASTFGRLRNILPVVPWLEEPGGSQRSDIPLDPRAFERQQAYFDLTYAPGWIRANAEGLPVDLEIWATLLNHGGSHTSRVSIGFTYGIDGSVRTLTLTEKPQPTDLLPGYSSAAQPSLPGLCQFVMPVFR